MSTEQAQGEKRTIEGGCHCGFIRYTVNAPLNAQGNLSATRCNCTFCQKLGSTNLSLPPEDFTLLSPPFPTSLGDYSPRPASGHRYFCKTCGAHVWMQGEYTYNGQVIPFFAVNVCTIDQPQEGVELSRTQLGYYDMLHGNVEGGKREGPWEGGLV